MGVVHPALYWLIIGVMMFFMELMLPGFIMLFFALGALITAGIAWYYPVSILSQLAIFIIASFVLLFALRDFLQKRFPSKRVAEQADDAENDQDETPLAVPGTKGVVCMMIAPPADGRIKYAGSYWRASADELIEEGEIVQVVQQNGSVIHVEKV